MNQFPPQYASVIGGAQVMDWIAFYNHRRLHSTLEYSSPMAFEKKWLARQISLAA
nr:IS3 family transposase [Sphingomonas sp. 37zxx]